MLLFANGYYHSIAPEDVIRFFRNGNEYWMEWKGKLGTWEIVNTPGKTFLEFRYNYAREDRYALTVIASQSGEITAFRLEDELGRSWDFQKARTSNS